MFKTDLYSLLCDADEAMIRGKKVVSFWFDDEGSDENHTLFVETEDETTYIFDNSVEVAYGEEGEDDAWLEDTTGNRQCVTAYNLSRTPLEAND